MDNAEVRELLEELLSAVRKYYTGAFREVSEPGEQENIRSAAGRAWNTLLSLFPDQPELDLDFVSQEGGDAVEPIITRLEEWAMAAQDSRPGGRNSLQYSVVANHADECMEQLDSLMADSRDRNRPASWPFVKLIRFETVSSSIPDIDAFLTTTRVYLSSPVLRTGLILADLPGMTFCICFLCWWLIHVCLGFRDLNYARIRATERYLRHNCNEVFIVSTIFRCTTDRSIGDIIRRRAQGQPIRIVCTRSEVSLPSPCHILRELMGWFRMWMRRRQHALPLQRNPDISRILTLEFRPLIEESDRCAPAGDKQLEVQVKIFLRSKPTWGKIEFIHSYCTWSWLRFVTAIRKKQLSLSRCSLELFPRELKTYADCCALAGRLKRFLISRRNMRVTESLSRAWGNQTRIFCVSNRLYTDHREMDLEQANQYLELSGIKELRRYCQSVPADAQLRATESFLQNQLPAILGSITLWASASADAVTVSRAETLCGVLNEADQTLHRVRWLSYYIAGHIFSYNIPSCTQ